MAPTRLSWARAIVQLAAVLVPPGQRADWRREWDAELASLADLPAHYRRPIARGLGAVADAFWLRQRSVADFDWIDDLRHGGRQLFEHRGFAAAVIAIASIGLAATVTMFSVTDQILLRPLPYPDADRIVTLWETRAPSDEPLEVTPGNLLDWRERLQSFESVAGADPWSIDMAGNPHPEVWFSAKVTEGFLESFGTQPIRGRLFLPEEYQKGRDRVLIISERFWQRRFGGDSGIIGRTVSGTDGAFTIVGVVPASFEPRVLPTASGHRDIWMPKAIEPYERQIRGSGYWAAVGRLKPGVTLEQAQAELSAVARQLATEYPRTNEKTGARVLALRDHLVGDVGLALLLLGGATGLVLLVACVNIANLLLARGSVRDREMAVRVSLGASRSQLMQQLLLESALILFAGGVMATLLARGALAALVRFGPTSVPWIETLHLDWRALAFAGLAAAIVALAAGLLPAWRLAGVGLASAGRQTTTADRTQHRMRAGLVVAEVALALVLVTGAGLLLRSFVGLMQVDPGFARDRVLVAQVFAWDFNPKPADLRRFFDTTIERLVALPAVQHAGAVSAMPFIESNINIQNLIAISGRPEQASGEAPRAFLSVATPGYFEAMGIPLKAGRALEPQDGPETRRVAVITDTLARRYWSENEDPIGAKLRFRFSGTQTDVEVVGVVGALRHDRLDRAARAELFMPLAQMPFGSMTFVVRTAGDAAPLLEPVRATIWAVNPQQTIYRSATLDELVQNTVSPRRFALGIMLSFAALALLLAIAGIYGVLSAITNARRREVGLRVALGASRWDIVGLTFRSGVRMAGLGLLVGLGGSLAASQLLRTFLFEVTPIDPATIGASAAVMGLAALAACYLPARRAAAADPVTVLRSE